MENNKVMNAIDFYQVRLERKRNLIKEYRVKNADYDYKMTEKEYAEFKVLEAEISLIEKFIEELEYINE